MMTSQAWNFFLRDIPHVGARDGGNIHSDVTRVVFLYGRNVENGVTSMLYFARLEGDEKIEGEIECRG